MVTKKPDFSGFLELFSVSRYSYPRPFRRPKNKRYRLRLLFLLDLQSSPTVLPSVLAHHVDPNSSPPEHTDQYTRVEMSGVAPESTAPSLGRNYNNSYIIYLTWFLVNRGPSYHQFWSKLETIKSTKTKRLLQLRQWQSWDLDSFHLPNRWATMPMATNSAMAAMAAQGMFFNMFIVRPDVHWSTWYHNKWLWPTRQKISATC